MQSKRNGAIDFWRFIFSVVLVLFHTHMMNIYDKYKGGSFPLHKGSLAVEFFLITSGFLLAASINRRGDTPFEWEDNWTFIKRKLMTFYPAYLICWTLTFIAINVVQFKDVITFVRNLFRSVFEITLIRNAGFDVGRVLPQAWYLSSMLLVMFLIYPIYRLDRKRFEYWIAPVIAVLTLGYLCDTTEGLLNPSFDMGFTFKGNLRALAEICLGVVCYVFCQKMKEREFTRLGQHILSLFELGGYAFAILYMQYYRRFPDQTQFTVLFFLAISVTISFSGMSSITPLFDHKIFNLLGRYSLYPYLTYSLFVETLPYLFPDMRMKTMIAIYLVLTFLTAALIMAAETAVRKRLRERKQLRVQAPTEV